MLNNIQNYLRDTNKLQNIFSTKIKVIKTIFMINQVIQIKLTYKIIYKTYEVIRVKIILIEFSIAKYK